MRTHDSRVQVQHLTKSFGARVLFNKLSFRVDASAMVALTGPSGAGKSTLLNCLGLLEPADSGSITLDGRVASVSSRRTRRLLRRDALGYLFQSYALMESSTIAENLSVAVGASGARRGSGALDPCSALERVGLGGREGDPVYTLSGGEQQRVALARLLVKAPPVILADEPTGALDEVNAHMVLDVLRMFAESGAAVVVATHSRDVVAVCDAEIHLSGR